MEQRSHYGIMDCAGIFLGGKSFLVQGRKEVFTREKVVQASRQKKTQIQTKPKKTKN